VETPKREKNGRTHLTREEYTKLLSLAGGNARDYAIFQVFLQTGIRVSELVALTLDDVDLSGRTLHIRAGKGMVARTIELEKKAMQALKGYLAVRLTGLYNQLFLNRYGEPISERGVEKLITRYVRQAGIKKKVTCHTLRHTFATYKAQHGISAYRLKEWLGHQSLETTQIYIHLGKQNALREMEATSL
jgi:site-specific recombinase XerD